MRVSREQFAENRRKIIEAASRLFKERGFDGVTVADVMKAAGLTHGGFYGHFVSKEDLISHAMAVAPESATRPSTVADFAQSYLSARHRDERGQGCNFAALGGEAARLSTEARSEMTEGLRQRIAALSTKDGAPDPKERRRAIAGWCTMVGALTLSRLSSDPELSDEILEEARRFLTD